jgi:hypothetical protein
MKSDMGLIMNIVLGIVGAAIASAILLFGIVLGMVRLPNIRLHRRGLMISSGPYGRLEYRRPRPLCTDRPLASTGGFLFLTTKPLATQGAPIVLIDWPSSSRWFGLGTIHIRSR